MAESTGKTSRGINQDIAIADGIPKKLRDDLRDTNPADSRDDLRALAKLKDDPAAQRKAVKAVRDGKADDLRGAIDKQHRPTKSAADQALDDLAECLKRHPDLDELTSNLAFFKKRPLPVGKLLYRLRL